MKLLTEEVPDLPSKRRKIENLPARPAIPVLKGGCPLILDHPKGSSNCSGAGTTGFRADNSCPLIPEPSPGSSSSSSSSGSNISSGSSAANICGADPLLGRPRESLDFRRPPKGALVFERKAVDFKSLLQDPNWREKASNEISLNTHAASTELSRISAKNKWHDYCAAEGRPECVKASPPSARDVNLFCGLLRCALPQSALTYASNWKSWVETERKQSFKLIAPGLQEEYSRCSSALAAAKGLAHKDAPFSPLLFVKLSQKVRGDCESLTLKMAIFSFWALLRMDEFNNLVVLRIKLESRGSVDSIDNIEACRAREIQDWKGVLKSGANFQKQPFSAGASSSSSTARVLRKSEGINIRVTRSKTRVGDSGLSVSFFCSCAWGKQLGMKRGFNLCPVHVMTDEDFANAKLAPKNTLRLNIDSLLGRIGITNKPSEAGLRRMYNLHSGRRGGAKYSIYSLGAPGTTTLGRWSHRSGTAMQEYVEEALCDPVSGPVPTWPLEASTLKLTDISIL